MKKYFIISLSLFIFCSVMAQEKLSREDLLQAMLHHETVSTVDIKKVVIPKGLAAGKHLHPCPVVGYIVSGSVLFQAEGEEKKILKQGDAFYEPKNKTILHFDNASPEEPLVFVAFYLKEGSEELIKMLP
jgi:quercetin dioxygenase-like cupin family protein